MACQNNTGRTSRLYHFDSSHLPDLRICSLSAIYTVKLDALADGLQKAAVCKMCVFTSL